MTMFTRLRAAAAALLMLAGAAVAQDPPLPPGEAVKPPEPELAEPGVAEGDPAGATPGGPPPFVSFVEFDSSFSGGADFDDTRGGFSVHGWRLAAGIFATVGTKTRLGVNVSHSTQSFNFQNSTMIVPGSESPWRRVLQTDVNFQFFHGLSERWTATVTGGFGINREDGASTSDAFQFRTFAGARYRILGNLHIVPGFFIQSRIEDSPIAFPVVGLEWDIDETFRLEVQRGVALGAALADQRKLELRLEGDWNLDRFRLDDTGANPDGIGSLRGTRVGLGLKWRPQPFIDVSLFGGGVFGRELRLENRRGRRIFRDDVDAGLQFNLSVRASF